jgi:hypothetical protein
MVPEILLPTIKLLSTTTFLERLVDSIHLMTLSLHDAVTSWTGAGCDTFRLVLVSHSIQGLKSVLSLVKNTVVQNTLYYISHLLARRWMQLLCQPLLKLSVIPLALLIGIHTPKRHGHEIRP